MLFSLLIVPVSCKAKVYGIDLHGGKDTIGSKLCPAKSLRKCFLGICGGLRRLRWFNAKELHPAMGAQGENIHEIREIRGSLSLYFKESKLAWKRVVRGQPE